MVSRDVSAADREKLKAKFKRMMSALFREEGAMMRVEVLQEQEVLSFIDAHASVLDNSFATVPMSERMRHDLQRTNWIFSGMKTFHELHEAFPSLVDENGQRKPFERFLNDVQKVDETYNRHYLRAEYNHATAAAEMASRWEQFEEDGDRYHLQYRTADDDQVREEHAALNRITLPASDAFWDTHLPPNGWNCRCNVVQVRKAKYPVTPTDEVQRRVIENDRQNARGRSEMFRYNAGKERKTFPDYNPYTLRQCNDCDLAKGRLTMAFVPSNEACAGCQLLRQCYGDKQKTEAAIQRKHYLHKMERLLTEKRVLDAGKETIKVGFSKAANKHLYSDVLGRSRTLQLDDLEHLDSVIERATYVDHSPLVHPNKIGIDHFYYYHAELHGQTIRLNVGRVVRIDREGKPRKSYVLYSINDVLK